MRSYHLRWPCPGPFIAVHFVFAQSGNIPPSTLPKADHSILARGCFPHLVGVLFFGASQVPSANRVSIDSFLCLFNIAHALAQYCSLIDLPATTQLLKSATAFDDRDVRLGPAVRAVMIRPMKGVGTGSLRTVMNDLSQRMKEPVFAIRYCV